MIWDEVFIVCFSTVLDRCFCRGANQVCFLTDLHVVPNNPNEAAQKQVVAEIEIQDEYDFVVITGDLSNMGSDAEAPFAWKAILDERQHPYYIIPGNHETNWSESAGMTLIGCGMPTASISP